MKVVHLSSVHLANDVRIFWKECSSLAKAGYQVSYVVPHAADTVIEGVRICSVSRAPRRWLRMTLTTWHIYRRAALERACLYHFHDPELIPVGLLLKRKGAKVIYDAHEDLPKQVMTKEWIPSFGRRALAHLAARLEQKASQEFDAIVAATPAIAQRFPASKTVVVQNFPRRDEFSNSCKLPFSERPMQIAYVGGLTRIRGAREMVMAMSYLQEIKDASLLIAGKIHPHGLERELSVIRGWERVRLLGWCERAQVAQLLGQSRAGLVVFRPAPNHVEAQPNKLFEYMAAGLPVIASNFPLWRELVDSNSCGVSVDPTDSRAIAEAIRRVLCYPQESEQMGQRGLRLVREQYNWEQEFGKMLSLYHDLIGKP